MKCVFLKKINIQYECGVCMFFPVSAQVLSRSSSFPLQSKDLQSGKLELLKMSGSLVYSPIVTLNSIKR